MACKNIKFETPLLTPLKKHKNSIIYPSSPMWLGVMVVSIPSITTKLLILKCFNIDGIILKINLLI